MPDPNPGEDKETFLQRCIPRLIKDEGYKPDQAVAICESKWREAHK